MSEDVKEGNDLETRVAKLEKGAKNTAYVVRRMKNWLEKLIGADIDGDGQIGRASRDSGRTSVSAMITLLLSGVIAASAASAYLFNLSPDGAAYPFSVGTNKTTYAENLTTSNAVTLTGLTASKPVFTDASKVLTSTGVLSVDQGGTGTNTLTEHGVMIGSGTGVVNVTGVGTDGQVFIGASTADPGWQTASGAFTMAANGAATLAGNIDIARITNALKVPGNIGETTPGEGSFSDLDITVRADIGGWGYSGEHAELVEDATGNTVPGFGHYNEIKTEITSGKVMAAKYTRLLCSSNQANDVTMVGTESQFRLRNVNIANGVHAGLWAYAEQSGTSVLSGNGTFDAIAATVESADTFTVGATEQVTGIMLDSSIGASATIAGAANFSAMYIKSNGKDWFNGLYITGCDNAILFDGGATIDQSAADTLTITEDNVAVAGALTATSYEGVVAATLVAGAAAGATAVQPADIWGAPTATPSPVLLTNTVAIQAKTDAGGDLSDYRVIRVWTSETSMGEASTNNIESIALSTGAAIETKTADADYIYLTASDGSAQAIIIGSATGTNYVMLMDGSSVSATAITFLP